VTLMTAGGKRRDVRVPKERSGDPIPVQDELRRARTVGCLGWSAIQRRTRAGCKAASRPVPTGDEFIGAIASWARPTYTEGDLVVVQRLADFVHCPVHHRLWRRPGHRGPRAGGCACRFRRSAPYPSNTLDIREVRPVGYRGAISRRLTTLTTATANPARGVGSRPG
jgi:hypothetical protein